MVGIFYFAYGGDGHFSVLNTLQITKTQILNICFWTWASDLLRLWPPTLGDRELVHHEIQCKKPDNILKPLSRFLHADVRAKIDMKAILI